MAIFYPGISERVFEFGFNAEYCAKNKAVLAGCPYIPTQNQEKRLGYDVKFKITKGALVTPLYLQHKVSRYVDKRVGSNKKYYDAVNGPYFAFMLDKDQYNLIHRASQKKGRQFYYCAPSFTSRKDMDVHYSADTVVNNSVWIDVASSDPIPVNDNDSHCIVYDSSAANAFRFSENANQARGLRPKNLLEDSVPRVKFGVDFLVQTYSELFLDLKEWWPDRRKAGRKSESREINVMPKLVPPMRDIDTIDAGIEAIRDITANYFGVSWLIGVDERVKLEGGLPVPSLCQENTETGKEQSAG